MKGRYGLFTAVAMITGVVIGSGIFFKSDDILILTKGSVPLGVLVFCLAAVSIIFGSLSIARLAAQSDGRGGVIAYAGQWYGAGAAGAFGWFHTFLYYPTLIAIVSWVAAYYLLSLLELPNTLMLQSVFTLVIAAATLLLNLFSPYLGGLFQNASTILKLAPLFFIGVAGVLAGTSQSVWQSIPGASGGNPVSWLAAVAPVAFAFDGWIVATSLGPEIRNSRRTLPLALTAAPLLILASYLLYFVGICTLVGPQQIMEMGDGHVAFAAQQLLGPWGGKALMFLVLISVLGTVNGLCMGLLRMPAALADKKLLPAALLQGSKAHTCVPLRCGLLCLASVLGWLAIHVMIVWQGLLPQSDISEISIVVNYGGYLLLYVAAIRATGKWLIPAIAMVGSLVILAGGAQNPFFLWFLLLCAIPVGGGLWYGRTHAKNVHF